MGKLNYANRKIEGEKLAQAIAKDLLKRVPLESGAKPAVKDTSIELYATDKNLTDDVIADISKNLIRALESREGFPTVHLDELNLGGNAITVHGLIHLQQIIKLAADDLKDLDLSSNRISISTDEDAAAWEMFLGSFRGCTTLRRLDLSGNPLGPRAFEILLRVYAHQPAVDVQEYMVDLGEEDDSDDAASTTIQRLPRLSSLPKAERYQMTRGLRSIPYLVFSDVEMSDTGALHLSYLVEAHHLPEDLLRFVPPPRQMAQAQMESHDKGGCRGIIYRPNANLTAAGERLLLLVESTRREARLSSAHVGSRAEDEAGALAEQRRRAPSVGAGPAGGLDVAGELERARSKIQGKTLEERGAGSVELWRRALRLLALSRALLVDRSDRPVPREGMEVWQRHRAASSAARAGPSAAAAEQQAAADAPSTSSPTRRRQRSARHSSTAGDAMDQVPRLINGMPEGVWRRIIIEAADPNGILDESQREAAIAWGRCRQTLSIEAELTSQPVKTQVWRVLCATGCLSYKIQD